MSIHALCTLVGQEWVLPQKADGRGKPAEVVKSDKPSFRVDQYCKALEKEDWTKIKVRNTKKQPINIIIADQFPISTDKSIEVEKSDTGEAEVDAVTGKLQWKFTLEPPKEKKLNFKYSVKYPKTYKLNIE